MTQGGGGGGQAKICGTYAGSLVRFGCYSVPTHKFFHRLRLHFFSTDFQDLPIFSLKFGDPTIFLRKIHIYKIFDPLTSRHLSVFKSLFCDLFFLLSFSVFELHKHVKSWQRSQTYLLRKELRIFLYHPQANRYFPSQHKYTTIQQEIVGPVERINTVPVYHRHQNKTRIRDLSSTRS